MADDSRTGPAGAGGLLPSQEIRNLVAAGAITAPATIAEAQIQPASLDLRLGAEAFRVRASFLPGPRATVAQRAEGFAMHRFSLEGGAVLEKGCVYIVPLLERVRLAPDVCGIANPKSSTGRLDVFTRLIVDHGVEFDQVPAGYHGPLYAEISPRAFSIVVRSGDRLNQLRLRRGGATATADRLPRLAEAGTGDDAAGGSTIERGVAVSVDLGGGGPGPIGWRARRHTGLIDIGRIGHYRPLEFWEPVTPEAEGSVILNPGDFYILASREAIAVPADHAAEMLAYDTRVGEFRVHYAGFFDPGFGDRDAGGAGSRAVLEIRSFEVPFALRDGQLVGRLVYERLTAVPDKLYGAGIGSAYQRQGLALAKQFASPPPP